MGGGVVILIIVVFFFGKRLQKAFHSRSNYQNVNVRYFRSSQSLDTTEPDRQPLIPSCPYPYPPLAVPRQRARNEGGDGRVVLEMGGGGEDRESRV